jgi:6-pyruvoyltetrahydropterin/6-carboxytetrahydropterin synthase
MHRLSRTVRFACGPGAALVRGGNGFGGRPALDAPAIFLELEVRCVGDPDPGTGYLINIKEIDAAVLANAAPLADAWCRGAGGAHAAPLVRDLLREVASGVPVGVESVALRLSPFLVMEAHMADASVLIRQRFEFSASHRLHVPTLGEEENRRLFGKCNNPAGHGHNYRVEPCVAIDPDRPLAAARLEEIVGEHVIEPFDHKHLNDQTDDFSFEHGVNPSVENIARVCFERLRGPIEAAGGHLRSVEVWETDRTSATYPA